MPCLKRRKADGGYFIRTWIPGSNSITTFQVTPEGVAYLGARGYSTGVEFPRTLIPQLRIRRLIYTYRSGPTNHAPDPNESDIAYRTPELYLITSHLGSSHASWHLEMFIPSPTTSVTNGTVRINHGRGGVVRLPLETLKATHGKFVKVQTVTAPYTAEIEDILDRRYTRSVIAELPGLATTQVNIFRLSAHRGRRLANGAPLEWGSAYAVVWHNDMHIERPEGVAWWYALHSSGPWMCAAIELPAEPIHSVSTWVETYWAGVVDTPPLRPALVAPIPYGFTIDGIPIVLPGEEIIVGLPATPGHVRSDFAFVDSPDGQVSTLTLYGELPIVFTIGHGEIGRYAISLSGSEDSALLVEVAEHRLPTRVLQPTLRFSNKQTPAEVVLPVYAAETEAKLQDVQSGTAEVIGIDGPGLTPIRLYSRGPSNIWSERVVVHAGSRTARSSTDELINEENARYAEREEIRQAISDAIADVSSDHILDFGSYGLLKLAARRPTRPRVTTILLPVSVQAQMAWLLSQRGAHGRRVPSDAVQRIRWIIDTHRNLDFSERDRFLIHLICRQTLWPLHIEPSLRDLLHSIECMLRRSDSENVVAQRDRENEDGMQHRRRRSALETHS